MTKSSNVPTLLHRAGGAPARPEAPEQTPEREPAPAITWEVQRGFPENESMGRAAPRFQDVLIRLRTAQPQAIPPAAEELAFRGVRGEVCQRLHASQAYRDYRALMGKMASGAPEIEALELKRDELALVRRRLPKTSLVGGALAKALLDAEHQQEQAEHQLRALRAGLALLQGEVEAARAEAARELAEIVHAIARETTQRLKRGLEQSQQAIGAAVSAALTEWSVHEAAPRYFIAMQDRKLSGLLDEAP